MVHVKEGTRSGKRKKGKECFSPFVQEKKGGNGVRKEGSGGVEPVFSNQGPVCLESQEEEGMHTLPGKKNHLESGQLEKKDRMTSSLLRGKKEQVFRNHSRKRKERNVAVDQVKKKGKVKGVQRELPSVWGSHRFNFSIPAQKWRRKKRVSAEGAPEKKKGGARHATRWGRAATTCFSAEEGELRQSYPEKRGQEEQ